MNYRKDNLELIGKVLELEEEGTIKRSGKKKWIKRRFIY